MQCKRQLFLLTLVLAVTTLQAQNLKPHIGLSSLPKDSDKACVIPMITSHDFSQYGYKVNETVADFTLYDKNDKEYKLSTLLSSKKPVLLISSSYTCPVFRGKIPLINQLQDSFGNDVQILVVYTVEAHPDKDTSPYFGRVNTGSQNVKEGVLYQQPTTYGERKAIVEDLLKDIAIKVPVLIDGPCNEWWINYAKAPNNATLIDTDGVVAAKHAWLDKYPDDINCDIKKLLGIPDPCGSGGGSTQKGSFTFEMLSRDTVWGEGGTTLTIDAEIKNETDYPTHIFVKRLANNFPSGWEGSLCMDICYPTNVDTTTIVVPAQTTQHFSFYFYANEGVDTGHVQVGFRNVHNHDNKYARDFYGIAQDPASVKEVRAHQAIYPNPVRESRLTIDVPDAHWVIATDVSGRATTFEIQNGQLDCSTWHSGLWFLRVLDKNFEHRGNFSIVKH